MNIPLFKNYRDKKDIEYINRVINRGMFWANGPEITEFENKIADFTGLKYCIAFNSGTSALHSVLSVYDIREKEVIVPSFTFISTANSVLMAGGQPVFADIEEETFGLDPEDIKPRITPKTKAIIPVHYGGCSCQIDKIRIIAKDHDLLLIEDAAESLGAKFKDEMVGSIGDAAMFSFTPTKIISTGEGGVIVTNSKEIFEKLRLYRSHGRLETEDYFSSTNYMDYITMGYNFRMPTMCAALGLAQLEKIETIIARRREIAKFYNKRLRNLKGIRVPSEPMNCYHTYQMYSILVEGGRKKRDSLQNFMREKGISTKVFFEPIHKTHFYGDKLGYDVKLKKTEEISGKTLSLPIYPDLSVEEMEYVCESIKQGNAYYE